MANRKSFGPTLRELRKARGFTLREFAQLLGVSPTYMSLVEQEKEKPPTAERIKLIAKILGISIDELLVLAGKLPEDLPKIIHGQPKALTSFLRTARHLTAKQINALTEQAKALAQEKQ